MRADKNTQPSGSAARRILKGFGKVFGTMVLVLFLTTLIFACLFALYVKNNLSAQVDSIDGFTLDQTSVIYYEDPKTGQDVVLRKLYGGANRTWVKYEDIPKNLIHACIAIEDKRFEDHQGVDWVTTLKACVKMFLGRGEAGGSTITQQLVKNITGRDEVTVRRKLVEIFSALELEKKYTKKQIMELYLNVIALGENCEGVESASQVYFGKSVSELDLAECAALIGITNNPSIYDPYINADKNKERQVIILDQMLEQKYITQEQHDTAVAEELVLHNASGEASGDEDYYSYFEDQVINDVVRDLSEKTGYDQTIVRKMLMTGGYKIYSTLNPDVQAAVEEVYQNLDNIPKTASSQQLQSGIVIIDNKTGDVVAVAGGVGEKQGKEVHLKEGKLTFALAGNQNCGKTTLFNQLTGANQHVGNFPGVTVDRKDGTIRNHPEATVTDLPGIYSLSPYSNEEIVTRDFLMNDRPSGIINIVDATNIERNLYLTMQLMELEIPMVLALNMMDEVRSNGGSVRINELEEILGIPVVPISAARNEGIDELIDHALYVARAEQKPQRVDFCLESLRLQGGGAERVFGGPGAQRPVGLHARHRAAGPLSHPRGKH